METLLMKGTTALVLRIIRIISNYPRKVNDGSNPATGKIGVI